MGGLLSKISKEFQLSLEALKGWVYKFLDTVEIGPSKHALWDYLKAWLAKTFGNKEEFEARFRSGKGDHTINWLQICSNLLDAVPIIGHIKGLL
jgi:hypothetical protein